MDDKKKILHGIIWGIVIAVILFGAFEFVGGYDYIKASFYTPSGEMQAIIDELDLTSHGVRVLKATGPKLSTREIFNEKCNSHNSEIYVLGCYVTQDDNIYLYDVDNEELAGVKESTTAHELLHAYYHRLPFWEKSGLNKELGKAYEALASDSEIRTNLELYGDDDFYDELHSRLGTEVKNLSPELEKHYAKIFNDQDKIVDLYEKYSSKFKQLEKELDEISKNIETMKIHINDETVRLETLSNDLNQKIDNYNKRIESGNYTSVAAAKSEGDALKAEIDSISRNYDDLNKYIEEYNKLIDKYNNNVIQTNKILDSMNSNSERFNNINN